MPCPGSFQWAEHSAQAQCLPGEGSAVWAPRLLDGCRAGRSVSSSPVCCAPSRPEEPSTWSGYMGKMFLAASNYLPAQVSDMMNQDRAFATGRLHFSGQRNICTLSTYVPRHPLSARRNR